MRLQDRPKPSRHKSKEYRSLTGLGKAAINSCVSLSLTCQNWIPGRSVLQETGTGMTLCRIQPVRQLRRLLNLNCRRFTASLIVVLSVTSSQRFSICGNIITRNVAYRGVCHRRLRNGTATTYGLPVLHFTVRERACSRLSRISYTPC